MDTELDPIDFAAIGGRFHETHDRLYGYATEQTPITLVNLRMSAIGVTDKTDYGEPAAADAGRYRETTKDSARSSCRKLQVLNR